MKREWIESTFVFLMFLAILLVVGFFNFSTLHIKPISELALNEIERIDLPFDLNRFPNSVLNCKAKNNQITVATLKAAAELKVKRSTPIEKILEKQHITGKQGVINLPADCSIKAEGLTINKDDILVGEGFLQDTPGLINENSKKIKNNTLIIYNTSFNDTEFKVESFLEDGTKALEKVINVKSFNLKTLKTKDNTAKTYRITPQSEGVSYLAIKRESIAGKIFTLKPLRTFSNAIISPKKGVLVVSNVTSAPATFRYIVTKNGEKRYEGKEWILPYSQRKISLAKLKSLKNAKMEITPISYYYPKVCNEDGKCYRDESRKDNTIVANYYNGKTFNAITNTEERFSDEIRYKNKIDKALPVSCKIDNVAKPYCDKDNNKNGIDDAEELFHYFANPEMEDADEDGFSNREEIEAGTKAFHPFDFPGAPKDDTVDGMYELAKLIEDKQDTQKRVLGSSIGVNRLSEVMTNAFLKPNSQIEGLIDSISYRNPNNLIDAACRGINICINGSPYSNEIAQYLDGCLNVMTQAVGEIVGEGCRHCKVNFDIKKLGEKCAKADLIVGFGPAGRSYYRADSTIIFDPNGLFLNPLSPNYFSYSLEQQRKQRRHTVCHELGHAFYSAEDRYTDLSFNIPSLYAGRDHFNKIGVTSCMTSYDMYILQLSVIRRITGKPFSEIIAQTIGCVTKDGKAGKIISGFSHECLEDWTTTSYKEKPRLYYPPNGQSKEDESWPVVTSIFKPECHCTKIDNGEGNFICCEDPSAKNCGGDCCSGECVNGECETNREIQCEENEVYDTESQKCCPSTNAINITSHGTGNCCNQSEVACGGGCCRWISCLESSKGQSCCSGKRPYACLNAIGSVDGCCERGCLNDRSNYSNSMCACGPFQHVISSHSAFTGYNTYLGCEDCPDGNVGCGEQCCASDEVCVFENGIDQCKKCPNGQERKENRCICSETKFETCNGECCPRDQVCSFVDGKRKCISCDDEHKPCFNKCCEWDEICEVNEISGSMTGICSRSFPSPMISDSPFDVFSPSSSLTPDFTFSPSPIETEVICPIGNDCIQKYPDRQCCGTVLDNSVSMQNDNRCTEFDDGSGGVCYCCSNIKDDPNHCDTKCIK